MWRNEGNIVSCKRVKQALRADKEKWIGEEMEEMEEYIKRHRHRNFFRRMRKLTNSRVIPTSTILDEKGHTIKNPEKLTRWQKHFADMLNVQKKAAEEVVSELEDHSHGETEELTRGEVEKAVWKLCNGKAAGQHEVVAELRMKNGGEVVIDWLTEQIQQVWHSGNIPQEWKDVTLIPPSPFQLCYVQNLIY